MAGDKLGRVVAFALRHRPEQFGISLDKDGWADMGLLMQGLSAQGYPVTAADMAKLVAADEKGRYVLSDDGSRIRAAQGHSAVKIRYRASTPPATLFHGTADRNVDAITRKGLHAGKRHYVHLSVDIETAISVGERHGNPVVFVVDTARMLSAGHRFYRADNGVWLTEEVPAKFLHVDPAAAPSGPRR